MRLALACVLLFGSLCADVVENVEEMLSSCGQSWKMHTKMVVESEKGNSSTRIYIPENGNGIEASECFAIHIISCADLAVEEFGDAMMEFFPDDLQLNEIEVNEDVLFGSWSAEDTRGWVKAFSDDCNLVVLQYFCDENEQTLLDWYSILKAFPAD